ncbi:conserved hypothetical protein [Ricinus communis]|uniref:RNase H type-1 domain-containing protein n=1 Tax=Ricinus communis TaxID=3988 RepID=B9T1L5_RICCO|nr:conserved hypothetical protein [Ricinus communis]
MVKACIDLLALDWHVTVVHVFGEANQVADWLANHAIELPIGIHEIVLLQGFFSCCKMSVLV